MTGVRVIREAEHFTTDEIALQNLRAVVRGSVILREEPSFELVRSGYRGTIKGYPFMIVRCREARDAMEAREFAKEHKMVVAVHGGSAAQGPRPCDDGLVIDISTMKGIDENVKDRFSHEAGWLFLENQ